MTDKERIAELEQELKTSAIAMDEENDRHIEHILILEQMVAELKQQLKAVEDQLKNHRCYQE